MNLPTISMKIYEMDLPENNFPLALQILSTSLAYDGFDVSSSSTKRIKTRNVKHKKETSKRIHFHKNNSIFLKKKR